MILSIPYPGSKKYVYKHVKEIVKRENYKRTYEPFGGSCLISVNLFNDGLVNEVYINDYDRIFDKYPEFLEIKDWIVDGCFDEGLVNCTHCNSGLTGRLKDKTKIPYPYPRRELPEKEREILQGYVAHIDPKWYQMLGWGNNFIYSSRASAGTVKLIDFRYFNGYVWTDRQREYLKVVQQLPRDTLDYKEFLEKHKDGFGKESLIIADPPYLCTSQEQYTEFTKEDTITLLKLLKASGSDFIFFNHDDPEILDVLIEAGITHFTRQIVGNINQTPTRKRLDAMYFIRGGSND